MLPLRPNLKKYSGTKPELRAKVNERNQHVHRTINHLHRMIADNEPGWHQYYFADIAIDLKIPMPLVRSAVAPLGGSNGITLFVREDDLQKLRARLKAQALNQ